ncbi:MAG: hypothetical protein JJW03_05835 [Desulfosarcina sp.]|nr:hypothetical protein [Desulfobacterales bacterium]
MGKLVCRIELDKKDGLILTVENGDASITQTIVMDGTSITSTVKGKSETSTITQKQDGIAVKCKTFTLDAETITCESEKKTLHKSGEDFDINSGKNLNISAASDAKYKAVNTTMESTVETVAKGSQAATLKLSGSESVLEGISIKLDSKGMLDLLSNGIATLKGTIVKIKDIVKLG